MKEFQSYDGGQFARTHNCSPDVINQYNFALVKVITHGKWGMSIFPPHIPWVKSICIREKKKADDPNDTGMVKCSRKTFINMLAWE